MGGRPRTDRYQFVAAEITFSDLCASVMDNHAQPPDIGGNLWQNFAHVGGLSRQNVVPLGSIFGFFIVVLNRFLQPLSFLIKLIFSLTMSLALFYTFLII